MAFTHTHTHTHTHTKGAEHLLGKNWGIFLLKGLGRILKDVLPPYCEVVGRLLGKSSYQLPSVCECMLHHIHEDAGHSAYSAPPLIKHLLRKGSTDKPRVLRKGRNWFSFAHCQ